MSSTESKIPEKVVFYPLVGFSIIIAWALSLGLGVAWNAYELTANFDLAIHYFFTIFLVCAACTSIMAFAVLNGNRDPSVVETVYLISAVIGSLVAFTWAGITAPKIPGVNDPKIAYTWGGLGYAAAISTGLLLISFIVYMIVAKVKDTRLSCNTV